MKTQKSVMAEILKDANAVVIVYDCSDADGLRKTETFLGGMRSLLPSTAAKTVPIMLL